MRNKRSYSIGLKDIAKACGLSTATVSMALRDMARVPKATREKVEECARKLGYIRDPSLGEALSRMRNSVRTDLETFALIVEDESSIAPGGEFPWLEAIYAEARHQAHLHGNEIVPVMLPVTEKEHQTMGRGLFNRGIRGLFIAPLVKRPSRRIELEWSKFAAVELGSTLEFPTIHRVERQYYDDLLELYAVLYERGYRRIGLAFTRRRNIFFRAMPEATLLYFKHYHHGLSITAPFYPDQREKSLPAFKSWIRNEMPEVVLVYGSDAPEWSRYVDSLRNVIIADLDLRDPSKFGLRADLPAMVRNAVSMLGRMVREGEWGLPRYRRTHGFKNLLNVPKPAGDP